MAAGFFDQRRISWPSHIDPAAPLPLDGGGKRAITPRPGGRTSPDSPSSQPSRLQLVRRQQQRQPGRSSGATSSASRSASRRAAGGRTRAQGLVGDRRHQAGKKAAHRPREWRMAVCLSDIAAGAKAGSGIFRRIPPRAGKEGGQTPSPPRREEGGKASDGGEGEENISGTPGHPPKGQDFSLFKTPPTIPLKISHHLSFPLLFSHHRFGCRLPFPLRRFSAHRLCGSRCAVQLHGSLPIRLRCRWRML